MPWFLAPLFMVIGAVLLVVATVRQTHILRSLGVTPWPPRPFDVRDYQAAQSAMATLRGTPPWRRMRWMIWAGVFFFVAGALTQLPDMLR